jgi:YD repeat-containing protein
VENRLVKATGMTGGPYCYVYDGLGRRVAKESSVICPLASRTGSNDTGIA